MARSIERYSVVGVQTAFGSAPDRATVVANARRAAELAEGAIDAYADWGFPIRLVAFCEFCVQGIPYGSASELAKHDVLLSPDDEALEPLRAVARRRGVFVHAGTILERDEAYPAHVFNTACVYGPDGLCLRYRKVNNWIPIETFTSPHSLARYDEELFPVASTEIGTLACLTCYDTIFPETYREVVSKGAELVIVANAYPSPWQTEAPTDWLTAVPKVRSLESVVYTLNVNQGGDLPPFQFNGGSALFDWEGRVVSQTLQRDEQYVFGHVDLAGLREWRSRTYQHLGPAHLRGGAYTAGATGPFAAGRYEPDQPVTQADLRRQIDEARERWRSGHAG